uniref:Uncharacterized protein n=1 Tax=Meloidogyne javanica TaxID=6303 RepID=A0A915MF07_MELJA
MFIFAFEHVFDNSRHKREITKYNDNDEEFFEESFQPTIEFNWAQEKIRRLAQSLLFSSPGIAITISHFPSYYKAKYVLPSKLKIKLETKYLRLVNGEELHYIVKRKPRQKHTLLELNLPNSLACLLLRSTSAWAVWISSFCFFFAILTLLIFYPIFLHKIMRQSLDWWYLTVPFILLEAVGDIPLLFVKFSPQHQPLRSSATSPAAAQLASVASEAAAAGAALSSMHRFYDGERL